MNDDFDGRLRDRLQQMEDTMPDLISTPRGRNPLRWSLPAVALVAALGIAAGAAGATAIQFATSGGPTPGVFSADGPLYCTRIQQMTPQEADPLLRQLGYAVTWQLEDRDARTSTRSTTPPSDGYIVEGVIVGRDLTLVVERGKDVQQVADPCPSRG